MYIYIGSKLLSIRVGYILQFPTIVKTASCGGVWSPSQSLSEANAWKKNLEMHGGLWNDASGDSDLAIRPGRTKFQTKEGTGHPTVEVQQ